MVYPKAPAESWCLGSALTRLPPRSVGRSLLGARLTVRIGVQAAFVGLPYPPPVAAVTAHRVALSEVPAHRAIDAKRPSRDCRSGGVKSVEGHPLLQ